MSFDEVIMFGDVILQCFALAAKLTEIKDALCLGTMRGREHKTLLNGNHTKIIKTLTCYLCPNVHPGLLGSLSRSKGGFETMVSN